MRKKLFEIVLSDDAETDFNNSWQYYFDENPKIADSFFKNINQSLAVIKRNPYSFPIVYRNVRKYVVNKFPFVIYYITEDSSVIVVAMFHTSRNPEIWNKRV